MDLIVDPPDFTYSAPIEENVMCVHSMIIGNTDTPYEGGFFHFYIRSVFTVRDLDPLSLSS